jgi:hypothetical protein
MTEPKFGLYRDTLIFRNSMGIEVDGQAVDTWIEDGERMYAVVDCTTPDYTEYERAEDEIRSIP